MRNYNKLELSPPLVTSYPYLAHLWSIFGNKPEYARWLYTANIQLSVDRNFKNRVMFHTGQALPVFMKVCPLLHSHGLSRSFIHNHFRSFTDFLIRCIDEAYYLYLIADRYELSVYRDCYHNFHMVHDIMIYGYDLSVDKVFVADFIDGFYQFFEVPIADLEKAFQLCPESKDWISGVMLIQKKDVTLEQMNPGMVRSIVLDYLHETNTAGFINTDYIIKEPQTDLRYGTAIYRTLTELAWQGQFEVINYHLLGEHKIIMLELIRQVTEDGFLPVEKYQLINPQYLDILDQCETLKMLVLRYKMFCSTNPAEKIIALLENIKYQEIQTLRMLLRYLKDSPAIPVP